MGLKMQLHKDDRILIGTATLCHVVDTGNCLLLDVAHPDPELTQLHFLEPGDVAQLHDDCGMRVLSVGRTVQVQFGAPRKLRILLIPADLSKWHANARRVAAGLKPGGSPRFND